MPFVTKKDRMISRRALATTFAAAFCVASLTLAGRLGAADAAHVKEVEAWRAKHEADYIKEYVQLAGLFFLKPGANTAGSGPSNDIVLPKSAPSSIGRFVYQNNAIRFEPRAGASVKLRNQPVTSSVELRSDGGALQTSFHRRYTPVHYAERRAIRMRDPHGEIRSKRGLLASRRQLPRQRKIIMIQRRASFRAESGR